MSYRPRWSEHLPDTDRECYARLCIDCQAKQRQVLQADVEDAGESLGRLQEELTGLVQTLQSLPGTWLTNWLKPRALERVATNEFDALLRSPYVAEIDLDPRKQQLLVLTVPMVGGSVNADSPSALLLGIGVRDCTLTVEPALTRTQGAILDAAATLLIGSGDLAGLLGLLGGRSSTCAAAPGSPRVASCARRAYIRWRTVVLLEAQAEEFSLEETESSLVTTSRKMTACIRKLALLEHGLESIKTAGVRSTAHYVREFDMLKELSMVKSISVDLDAIHVYTEPIVLSVEGNRHRIGCFRIDIHPGKRVVMRNLDNPLYSVSRHRYDHPHVRDGQPCWGDSGAFFATKLAQHSFPAIIQQALEFLQSYHPRDVFVRAERWSDPGGERVRGLFEQLRVPGAPRFRPTGE